MKTTKIKWSLPGAVSTRQLTISTDTVSGYATLVLQGVGGVTSLSAISYEDLERVVLTIDLLLSEDEEDGE